MFLISYDGDMVIVHNYQKLECEINCISVVWKKYEGIPDERKNTSVFPLIPTVPGPEAVANRLTTEKAPLITPKPKPDTIINYNNNTNVSLWITEWKWTL